MGSTRRGGGSSTGHGLLHRLLLVPRRVISPDGPCVRPVVSPWAVFLWLPRAVGSRGFSNQFCDTSWNLPLMGGLVLGNPFLLYHRSGFHLPQSCSLWFPDSRFKANQEGVSHFSVELTLRGASSPMKPGATWFEWNPFWFPSHDHPEHELTNVIRSWLLTIVNAGSLPRRSFTRWSCTALASHLSTCNIVRSRRMKRWTLFVKPPSLKLRFAVWARFRHGHGQMESPGLEDELLTDSLKIGQWALHFWNVYLLWAHKLGC